MKDVKDLKAWQLYVGQSMWLFFIGIVFFLLKMLLEMTFLAKSSSFQSAYRIVEEIGTGKADADDGKKFAASILGVHEPISSGLY